MMNDDDDDDDDCSSLLENLCRYTANQERAHDLCPRLFIGAKNEGPTAESGVEFLGLKSRYISCGVGSNPLRTSYGVWGAL